MVSSKKFKVFFALSFLLIFSSPVSVFSMELGATRGIVRNQVGAPEGIECIVSEFLKVDAFIEKLNPGVKADYWKKVFEQYVPCMAKIKNEGQEDVKVDLDSFLGKLGEDLIPSIQALKDMPTGRVKLGLFQLLILGIKVGAIVGLDYGTKYLVQATGLQALEHIKPMALGLFAGGSTFVTDKLSGKKTEQLKEPAKAIAQTKEYVRSGKINVPKGQPEKFLFFVKRLAPGQMRGSQPITRRLVLKEAYITIAETPCTLEIGESTAENVV